MALLDDLVSYWKLDEASGNAQDAHGSNTLTDNGTVGTGTGKVGNARDFERSNSEHFEVADNASLSMGDVDWTITCWVNLESKPAFGGIAGKLGTTSREYLLYYDGGLDRFVAVSRATDDLSESFAAADVLGSPSTGVWYFIACWHDSVANEIGIQVDDGTADTTSHSGGTLDGGEAFRVGAFEPSGGHFFDGLIDEVGLWKRVLSGTEKTQLYNGGSGLAYESFGGGTAVPVFRHHLVQQKVA